MPDDGFAGLSAPRVELRRFQPGDVDAFVAYRSVDEVARYQGWDAPYPWAIINAASMTGYLLGGLLLAVLSVRACIAAAGLFGLGMTAAFAAPLLRAATRDREQRGLAVDGGPLSPVGGPLSPVSGSRRPVRPR